VAGTAAMTASRAASSALIIGDLAPVLIGVQASIRLTKTSRARCQIAVSPFLEIRRISI
jgi:hypothetical protein